MFSFSFFLSFSFSFFSFPFLSFFPPATTPPLVLSPPTDASKLGGSTCDRAVTAGGGLACIGAATAGDGSACGGVATAGDGSACGRAAAAGDGVGGAAGSCRGVATFLHSSSSIPSPTGRQPSLALSRELVRLFK
jgi:hypothetical protein